MITSNYNPVENMAKEQVKAFYHSGTQFEKEMLREYYADMILKNMHSLIDVKMDPRQMAKEKSIVRKSLQGLSLEEM